MVKTELPLQGTQVGELRSHRLCSVAKNNNNGPLNRAGGQCCSP